MARTHNIAQREDIHLDCPVLFDVFAQWSDLFSFSYFDAMRGKLAGDDAACFEHICMEYRAA